MRGSHQAATEVEVVTTLKTGRGNISLAFSNLPFSKRVMDRRTFMIVLAGGFLASCCHSVKATGRQVLKEDCVEDSLSEDPAKNLIDRPDTNSPLLKLLTWNIWMMPAWTFQSPSNEARAEAIAAELCKLDFDILCLQKVFDPGARAVITKGLSSRYPYCYGSGNSSCLVSSGLLTISRFELSNYRELKFRDLAGIEIFSCKGAMLLTGLFAKHPFHIINTHLQGDDTPNADCQPVRNKEMIQIQNELVAPNVRPGVPLFLCGDFCTPRQDRANRQIESDGYRHMIQTFGAENGPEARVTLDDNTCRNDLAIDDTGRTDELDYILVRQNGVDLHPEWTRHILRHPGWDGAKEPKKDLSYRYAVSASIAFR